MVVRLVAAEQGGSMTLRGGTPLVQHRRLRGRLRNARETLNLTQRDVAQALEWSTSKLIRIENGSVGISITDLKALLLHYGITDEADVNQLAEMARASKKSAWWQEYRNTVPSQFLTFLGLEASAIRVRQFQSIVVPGLLQTPSYISNLMSIGRGKTEQFYREIRLRRQEFITMDNAVEAFFILDESVLYRQIGDAAVMREQLLKLKEMANRPNISIQIAPFSAGVHQAMKGCFEIMELSDQPDDYALLIEGPSKDRLISDPNEETREFVQLFFELEKLALPATETLRMIDKRLEEMDKES